MTTYYTEQVIVDINGMSHSYKMESRRSMSDSRYQAYCEALRDGYIPPRLKEKWYQFWRPSKYCKELQDAISERVEDDEDMLSVLNACMNSESGIVFAQRNDDGTLDIREEVAK